MHYDSIKEAGERRGTMSEALREKYNEIIEEAGKRNASADSTRIRKIIELCNELLSSENTSESAVSEALIEANDALCWLREQAVTKTEDGNDYPAEAYAYAPDKQKPSTWKLRLWEDPDKKVTRRQLGAAAAAFSPGGFRGQKVQLPSEDVVASVKAKIRASYRKIGVEDDDIPKWIKENETRTILADYISLEEAKVDTKGRAHLVVIKPGFNAGKQRYYPAEMLARDYPVFEGVKMYADHPSESDERERPERSIKDWVATLQNVRPGPDNVILGEAVIVEPWMQEKLATLRDKGLLKEMGISINAVGTATKADIQGTKTNLIERIVRARSVDFVTEAGAGGGVELYEADRDVDVDLVDADTLRERRPDLVKEIESAAKAEIREEVQKKVELEEQVKELTSQVESLTKERDEATAKLEEADKAKVRAEAQATIKEAVGKAELPEAAKTRLLKAYEIAESAEGIEEAIKAEVDYIAQLTEAGEIKGMGPGPWPSGNQEEVSREALKESWRHKHPDWSEEQLENAIR